MIKLTEKASSEIKKVIEEQKMKIEEHALRIKVMGGGCAGFQYGLEFTKKEEIDPLNDLVSDISGLQVVVDRKSDMYIDGTEVDFHEGLDSRGFVFSNPLASKGCGCGKSFS